MSLIWLDVAHFSDFQSFFESFEIFLKIYKIFEISQIFQKIFEIFLKIFEIMYCRGGGGKRFYSKQLGRWVNYALRGLHIMKFLRIFDAMYTYRGFTILS